MPAELNRQEVSRVQRRRFSAQAGVTANFEAVHVAVHVAVHAAVHEQEEFCCICLTKQRSGLEQKKLCSHVRS